MSPFHTSRASSYPGSSGVMTVPSRARRNSSYREMTCVMGFAPFPVGAHLGRRLLGTGTRAVPVRLTTVLRLSVLPRCPERVEGERNSVNERAFDDSPCQRDRDPLGRRRAVAGRAPRGVDL